jgi:dinuclear metal center YbgI/SA1388 family protein
MGLKSKINKSMRIKEITDYLESIAPLALQESYDNCGLLVGDASEEISGILITLDVTEAILEEAMTKGCNFIIAHHPVIFSGLKKVTPKDITGRIIRKAIQNNLNLYAAHTNMDAIAEGVNGKIASKLGLTSCTVLNPKKDLLKKLVTYCPVEAAENLRQTLFEAGGGHIGKYDSCSFNTAGTGTFRALEGAVPFAGALGQLHHEKETRIEMVYHAYNESALIRSLLAHHPYEEVAYDLLSLTNETAIAGAGLVGYLQEEADPLEFLKHVKTVMQANGIRYTNLGTKKIKKVAVCGGSGSFLLGSAIRHQADIFITADYKYHQFFEAENNIIIADIGHYESEQYTKELFYELLIKKKPTFAVHLSELNTNPINYL